LQEATTPTGEPWSPDDALSTASQNLVLQKLEEKGADPISVEDLRDAMNQVATEAKEWSSKNFTMVKRLQEAARNQGCVDLMRNQGDGGRLVAVKRMPTKWVCKDAQEFEKRYPSSSERPWGDIGMLRKLNTLRFPFVCTLHKVFRSSDETFVVSSFCTEGDLFGWCNQDTLPPPGKKREKLMVPICAQIFLAVRWLHELGIAHRDLSLENVLLTRSSTGDLTVKVIDFGMATLARICKREVRGKLAYQSPEMHTEPQYDAFLGDAFAVGVVLFGMAAQDYPWSCTKQKSCQLFEYVRMFGLKRFLENRKLRRGNGERLISVFTPAFTDLVVALLEIQPSSRACLGERCFQQEATGRRSVWDLPWIHASGGDKKSSRNYACSPHEVIDSPGLGRLNTYERHGSDGSTGALKQVGCFNWWW